MITVRKLRYRALAIEDLRIEQGVTSIIGKNGSGKTTFLKLLAGIAVPDSGTILIDGKTPRLTEVGWVNEFPDRNLIFGNAFEEIASPLRFRHLPCPEIRDQVESITGSLGIQDLLTRQMANISGGEKVLVALAAALVTNPRVLVLDEYDSHLDMHRTGEISGIIKKQMIPYVIHCTQDTEAAARGDYVIFLNKGNVVLAGQPEEVFASLAGTAYYPLSWKCRT